MASNEKYQNPVYPNIIPETTWEPLCLPNELWNQLARDSFWSTENGAVLWNPEYSDTNKTVSELTLTLVPTGAQEYSMSISSPAEVPPEAISHASALPEVHQETTPEQLNSGIMPEVPMELCPSKLRQLLSTVPRPYVCIHCGKSYVRQRSFETHMQEHAGVSNLDLDQGKKSKPKKPTFAYKCFYCGLEFPNSAAELEDGSHDSASCVTTILRTVPPPKYHRLWFP